MEPAHLELCDVPVPPPLLALISAMALVALNCAWLDVSGVVWALPSLPWSFLAVQPGFLAMKFHLSIPPSHPELPVQVTHRLEKAACGFPYFTLISKNTKKLTQCFHTPATGGLLNDFSRAHRLCMQRSSVQILTCLCLGLCIQKAV